MNTFIVSICALALISLGCAQPVTDAKAESSLDSFLKQTEQMVGIVPNENAAQSRSTNGGFFENVESYIRNHDIVIRSPFAFAQGATFKFSPRNIDQNELNMSVNLPSEDEDTTGAVVEDRGRKSKLKKILVPIFVFVLLKAMTLIPLAIGVLGLKAWNALQLSFFSFLVSVSLAIFQLCKKIAADSQPQGAVHIPLDGHFAAARNFELPSAIESQNLAYRGYEQAAL